MTTVRVAVAIAARLTRRRPRPRPRPRPRLRTPRARRRDFLPTSRSSAPARRDALEAPVRAATGRAELRLVHPCRRLEVERDVADRDRRTRLRLPGGTVRPRRPAAPADRPGSRPPRRCRSWSARTHRSDFSPRTMKPLRSFGRDDREAGVVDRARPQHDLGPARAPDGRLDRPRPPAASAKVSSRSPACATAEIANTRSPRASRSRAHQFGELGRLGHVDLVQRHQPRLGQQFAERPLVLGQLGFEGVQVAERVAAGSSVAQSRTCSSTAQRSTWRRNSRPRPSSLRRAGDQPGHVGDRERSRRPR